MIKVKNLDFSYAKHQIFKDFNLDVKKNEVTMITGVNGVGKSTLLRLMAGTLLPDGGEIIFSKDMGKEPKKRIGFISDKLSLYQSMTVKEAITFHQSFYDIKQFDETMIKHAKISETQVISELSMGQRTLLHLSLIMLSRPEVLLIDEIIHSIDVYLREIFLKYLINIIHEYKMTLVMVNLNFSDIEGILQRVILLRDGKILVDEGIEELKSKVKKVTNDQASISQPTLFTQRILNMYDHYIYPFKDEYKGKIAGKIIDLNLTQIVKAFISKEYT